MKSIIFLFILIFSLSSYAEEDKYQAIYQSLKCIGIAVDNGKMYAANWTFKHIGGSGSEVDIRYNKKKRLGKIRTTVYENGNLYGRGKWIGRTSSRIYNTLVEINYIKEKNTFELISLFNPDNFHMAGKCNN